MATLGQQLKTAREAKGLSESDVGSATKILTKVIRALESDDFSAMPAPTYAKGFIRLYAKHLGLDPAPLVEEYLREHAPGPRPLIDPSSQLEQNSRPAGQFKVPNIPLPKLASFGKIGTALAGGARRCKQAVGQGWNALPGQNWKDIRVLAGAVAVILVLILIISSISTCARRRTANHPETPAPELAPARLLLDEPVPDLYLVEPEKFETN